MGAGSCSANDVEVSMIRKFVVKLSRTLFSWLAVRADRYWAR